MPEAVLLSGFQSFLQTNAGSRQEVGGRGRCGFLRKQRVKIVLRLQFRCAVGTAGYMLFEFMTGVICQLPIHMQRDIFSNPFALHNRTPSGETNSKFMWVQPPSAVRRTQSGFSPYLISANCPRNFCVTRKSLFFAVSSVVCKISPTVRNFNPS